MTDGLTPGGQQRYRSYVLRLWEVENDGQPVWRASLQDSHTGQRRGFADMAALAAFLAEQTHPQAGAKNAAVPALPAAE